jgi:cellulose synthase/poly-beta-1,6-N-acetylglucosamine synthase-like glycosyltransferase
MLTAYSIIYIYITFSALLYLGMMQFYSSGIKHVYKPTMEQKTASTFITVVVCFRNEENNLPILLNSLIAQSYPSHLFEILLYNDASTDGSLAVIKNIQAQNKSHQIICKDVVIKQGCNSPKKLAINDAAAYSKANLIVVTDADCQVFSDWLITIEQCYTQQKALLIAAPVIVESQNFWLQKLQGIEMQTLAAVTAGAIGHKKALMCNGANMAFDRKTFLYLDPYQYNHHISSGDDMFLLQSMQKEKAQHIEFLAHQNAMVNTKAKNDLKSYIHQRVRWASKSKNYNTNGIKAVALIVFNMNVALLFSPLLLLFVKGNVSLALIILLFFTKQISDYLCLNSYNKAVNLKVNYLNLLLYQYLEALLTVMVALKSIKGSYIWKERKQHF